MQYGSKLFVVQFQNPTTREGRQIFVMAENAVNAAGCAEKQKMPGEKIVITEAHEAVFVADAYNGSTCTYPGLDQPEEPAPETKPLF